jgi:hypothetical protein
VKLGRTQERLRRLQKKRNAKPGKLQEELKGKQRKLQKKWKVKPEKLQIGSRRQQGKREASGILRKADSYMREAED